MIELLLEAERALSFGLLDRAQVIYEGVAESDPHNSIAVVGLARVALERGDETGAYELARRALAIDPENDAARRMAARLEEVAATRGEPIGESHMSAPDPPPSPAAQPPPAPDAPEPAPGPPVTQPRRSIIDRIRGR